MPNFCSLNINSYKKIDIKNKSRISNNYTNKQYYE